MRYAVFRGLGLCWSHFQLQELKWEITQNPSSLQQRRNASVYGEGTTANRSRVKGISACSW